MHGSLWFLAGIAACLVVWLAARALRAHRSMPVKHTLESGMTRVPPLLD